MLLLFRYDHVVVDVVPTKHHEAVHVIYLSCTDGSITKITVIPRTQETCVVETLQPSLQGGNGINVMKLFKGTVSLYIYNCTLNYCMEI